jgi:hypothetical protein
MDVDIDIKAGSRIKLPDVPKLVGRPSPPRWNPLPENYWNPMDLSENQKS